MSTPVNEFEWTRRSVVTSIVSAIIGILALNWAVLAQVVNWKVESGIATSIADYKKDMDRQLVEATAQIAQKDTQIAAFQKKVEEQEQAFRDVYATSIDCQRRLRATEIKLQVAQANEGGAMAPAEGTKMESTTTTTEEKK